jgi:thioredoxin 1|tara:strand:- start:151 stop:1461 length:1311 start_codon:yes stop_codon:yes gene_type:complete
LTAPRNTTTTVNKKAKMSETTPTPTPKYQPAYLSEAQKAEEARLKGNDFYKQRRYHDAINCYCDSINIHPTSSALSNLAIALSGAGPTQYRLNVVRCVLMSLSLEPDRVKAVEKLNTELTLSGDIEAAASMASGEMMKSMDGFTPKRVRECFEKMQKENVFPRKCEENLKDLSACLRQVFIGKETGNGCFRAGDFEEAKNAYTAGINAARAEYSKSVDDGDMKRALTPGVSILLCNRSLMKSKLGDFQGALDDANEAMRAVLDGDVCYVKAILRKADALKKLKKFDDAFEAYFVCWTRLPGDANIAKELNECVEKSQTKRSEKDFKAIAGPRACSDIKEYNTLIKNYELVLIDFHAKWCGPCKQIAPAYASMNLNKYRSVLFLKVDVDEAQEIAAREEVQAMPTFVLYRYGVKMDVMRGADVSALDSMVSRWTQTV